MKKVELKNFKDYRHLIEIHNTSRITMSRDSNVNSMVYYEELTENLAKLKIGKYCSISTQVSFYLGGNHNINRISTWLPYYDMEFNQERDLLTNGDIIIENDVWISRQVIILSGVKIGNGAVIGAGAVVSRDVDPYSIVVGNPARSVKNRFSDSQIEILQDSKWWDWDPEKIKKYSSIIFGESFEKFEELVKNNRK